MEPNTEKFKVGDKVTVFTGFNSKPTAVRLIEKISEKRGDVTLENYPTKFKNGSGYGHELGEGSGRWEKASIRHWRQEHSDKIQRNNALETLKRLNAEILSNEELAKIMEIVLPAIEKAKQAKEEKKS